MNFNLYCIDCHTPRHTDFTEEFNPKPVYPNYYPPYEYTPHPPSDYPYNPGYTPSDDYSHNAQHKETFDGKFRFYLIFRKRNIVTRF